MEINKELAKIKEEFYGTDDLIIKKIETANTDFAVVYIDAMIDKDQLELGIIRPLVESTGKFEKTLLGLDKVLCTAAKVKPLQDYDMVINDIASGECLLLIDGADDYFIIPIRFYVMRAVSEPPTSAVLKGPREGFTEDIKTNMTLTRRRIRSNKLVFKQTKVGRFTQTSVAVAYLEGITTQSLVDDVLERIQQIDIDGIIDSSYIAKYLEAKNYSIFRQSGTSEKPDIVAAKMLEGRIAVYVDGSPIVLTLPFLLMEDFQDSQDYFKRNIRATILRIMRVIAVFFSLVLPGLFVALQQHQFQMLPLKLLITILASVNGIPFSPIIEMIVALVLFEVLGEASVRMPRYVGMAISIVGAIVLGETAVKAGLLSSLTVLITALSGIGLYAIPDEVGTFSILRLVFVIIGGSMGLFGLILGGLAIICYLTTLEVYGVPYLAPFAPFIASDLKDTLFKASLKDSNPRPKSLLNKNMTRSK